MRTDLKTLLPSLPFLFAGAAFGAGPSSFDQALENIVQRSTRIAAEQANMGATVSRNIPTRLFYLPKIEISGTQTNSATANAAAVPALRSIEASASLNLFKFGSDYAAIRAASLEEESQHAAVDTAFFDAEEEGVQTLIAWVQRGKETGTAEQLAKSEEQLHRIARERYDRGLLARQEVEKVAIDLSNARARLADAKIRQTDVRAKVVALLGHAEVALEFPWQTRLLTGDFTALTRDDSFVLAARPDWREAKARVEAEEQLARKQYRAMLPSLDATATYGLSGYSGQSFSRGFTAGLSLSFSIFDRLSNYSAGRAQDFSRAASESRLEQVQRDAQAGWSAARESFQIARESAIAREKNLQLSRRIYQDNQRRFQQGRVNANDLLAEQSRVFDSELLAIQSWSQSHLALLRLCHALGRRLNDCFGRIVELKKPEASQS